jgi:Zn-dependent peptidase ImmA (M78 family)
MRTSATRSSPSMPVLAIEQKAMTCIQQCMKSLSLEHTTLPIPVDQWIEHPMGIRFGVEDLGRLGENVLGATFIREREILVSDRLADQEPRFRFTCAHELGHFVLHSHLVRAFKDTAIEPGRRGHHEREADRFAAAFLMPAPMVVNVLFQICYERKLDPCQVLITLMERSAQTLTLWKRNILPAMTRRFNVSLSAAVFRFHHMCLPDGLPFLAEEQMPPLLMRQEQ